MKYIFFLFLTISIVACKNEKHGGKLETIDPAKVNGVAPVDPKTLTVPSAASLIAAEEVQDILNVKTTVNLKESNDPTNDKNKSCFFKWDDPNTPNAGILIQVLTNPVYDDYPQYVSNFISSKIKDGEMEMGKDTPIKYSDFDAGNRPGAYSFQQSRFYWTGDNNYLFMLQFNVSTLSERSMVNAAEEIAEIVNSNFVKSTKK